eukprot:12713465-Ditylum_brightwellii.AAC.1
MHKPLAKKMNCAKKEHNTNGKGKCHNKQKLHHKRRYGSEKHHTRKCKNKKHVQPMHHITEQQWLWQVRFVKDAEKQAKKRGLSAKE